MSDLDALLAAVIAHPAEDTPRLAYADCLEEQGAGWYAQFIRDQIAGVPRAVPRSAVVPLEPLLGLCVGRRPDGAVVTGRGSVVFRRGFADEVTCPAEDWLAHGRDARRLHPITRVNLTTVPDHGLLSRWSDGARALVVVHGLNTNVPLGEPPTPERLRDYVLHILSVEFPEVAFTLPEPFRPVAAALEQITGRRA